MRKAAILVGSFLAVALALVGWWEWATRGTRARSEVQPEAPFHLPTSEERRAAVGPTASLPPFLRASLAETGFYPLPSPGLDDWLTFFPEKGQTFPAFVASRPHRPDAARNKLYLQPLASAHGRALPSVDFLRRYAEAFFGVPVAVLPPLDFAGAGITERRPEEQEERQLLTGDLLALFKRRLPGDAFALVGVTMEDLYPGPDFNFVFGQASLRDRVGVYSFARFSPAFFHQAPAPGDDNLVLLRAAKVLSHETAHAFGLAHCIYYRCVMNGSNHLAELDARPVELCPVCLRKLQWSTGLDAERRTERLGALWRSAGYGDIAAWYERRLARLRRSVEG